MTKRISDDAEKAIYEAWEKTRPEPKALAATLQTEGHDVSYRTVLRRYATFDAAKAAYASTSGAQRWRLTDARTAEELGVILPAVVSAAREGRALSKDEAEVYLAIRRALPQRNPDFVLYLTGHYDQARRGGSVFPTRSDYTLDEIDDWIAFAHVDQTQPGVLEQAMESGQVRKIGGWGRQAIVLAEPLVHTCGRRFFSNENYTRHTKDCDGMPVVEQTTVSKRKGGARRDKKSPR